MALELVDYVNIALLVFLIASSLAVCFIRNLLHAVIIYGVYSLTMAVLWLQMNTPDLAITEAAAGIGMTALMFAVITRINRKEE